MSASIQQQFTTWVRSKPADEVYDYLGASNCAYAQFEKAADCYIGERHDPRTAFPGELLLPESVADALNDTPHTFGALLTRLEASA